MSAPTAISNRRRWGITAGVMTGMFLAALEATVIATAMPTVVASLGGMNHYSWVFSAYLVSSTVTVPIWGKLSDLYGRGMLYQAAIGVFILGSIACGASQTMIQLVAARTLQGIGAGGLVPLGMTIVGDIYTLQERARMQGFFSGVWGLASIIGPLVGGWITDFWSWRWVFYINIPFGIAAAVIIGFALVEPPRARGVKIDYAGAITLTAAVTLLMMSVVDGGAALRNPVNLAMLAGAAIMTVVFVRIERKAEHPVVPLRLFRNRVLTIAVIAGFFSGAAMFGAITFVPLFAQGARGASATEAGSMLTPLMLSWVIISVVGGRLLLKIGVRKMVMGGLLLLTLAVSAFAFFGRTTPRSLLVIDLIAIGAGLGLTMLTLLLAVQHSVPRSDLGVSTSLNQFSRTIGGAIGVAIMGAVLSTGLEMHLTSTPVAGTTEAQMRTLAADPGALVDPELRAALPPAAVDRLQSSLAIAMRNVFLLGGLASLLALISSFWLPRDDAPPNSAPHTENMVMAEMTTIDEEHEPVVMGRE